MGAGYVCLPSACPHSALAWHIRSITWGAGQLSNLQMPERADDQTSLLPPPCRYHFSCQFTADLIAMNHADFIVTSTYQASRKRAGEGRMPLGASCWG